MKVLLAVLCIWLVFVEAKYEDGLEENTLSNSKFSPLPTDASFKKNSDEIMETAEVYFRPLSRYRELQKKKNRTDETGKDVRKNYDTTLLSKNPEYCLPAKGGVICFYKV